jgi:hypothetical protein
MKPTAFDLGRSYVWLDSGGSARLEVAGSEFWSALEAGRLHTGERLLGTIPLADFPHWEMHPAGDEILLALSGAAELVLDFASGEKRVSLTRETPCYIVPQGIWHRLLVREPGLLMFLTAGTGTQHRPI